MDEAHARELLAAERERIERALAAVDDASPEEAPDEIDPSDEGEALYQEAFDEGIGEDLREQLAAVERAEARLTAGTYGLSVESGQPIPDERLEARPTAELTVEEENARG